MSDPTRLRDLPGQDFSRELLRSATPTRALGPADALRLQPMVAKVAATPSLGAVLMAKYGAHALVLLGLASSGVVAARGVRSFNARRSPAPVVRVVTPPPPLALAPAPAADTPAATAPTAEASAPAVPVVLDAPTPSRAHRPPRVRSEAPTLAVTAPPPAREATLAEELAVMRQARAAMPRDPDQAERLLTTSLRDLHGGQLAHDRAALRVEALLRAGRRVEAEAGLRALEASAPGTPATSRLRAMLRDAP